jgi:sporulation protein YlmC with PRC-barrel domain
MAHYGVLRDYHFPGDVDDIRGAKLYGRDDEKLGAIKDVIFDHATGTIQYAVVDTGGWLSTKEFLVPADRIHSYEKDEAEFAIDATKQQIEALPKYDEEAVKNDTQWNDYDRKYREAWGSGPILHKEGSTHTITPEASELPAGTGSGIDDEAYTPERLAGKFPAAAADSSKLRMRPAGIAARAEDTRLPGRFTPEEKPILAAEEAEDRATDDPLQGQRDHLTNPDRVYLSQRARAARWAAFEDHLRRNRVDVTAACGSCGTARDNVA